MWHSTALGSSMSIDDTSQRACIHLGHHNHSVKVGDYRQSRQKIDALIKEHVGRTP